MKFKSEQTVYSPLKKKNVPLWVLDTNALTMSHYNADKDTIEVKTYHSDYVKYHLSFSASHYPDRLRLQICLDRFFTLFVTEQDRYFQRAG